MACPHGLPSRHHNHKLTWRANLNKNKNRTNETKKAPDEAPFSDQSNELS